MSGEDVRPSGSAGRGGLPETTLNETPAQKKAAAKTVLLPNARAALLTPAASAEKPKEAPGKTPEKRRSEVAKTVLLPNARASFLAEEGVETRPAVTLKPPEKPGTEKTVLLATAPAPAMEAPAPPAAPPPAGDKARSERRKSYRFDGPRLMQAWKEESDRPASGSTPPPPSAPAA